jgi:antirestriction protein ArdC
MKQFVTWTRPSSGLPPSLPSFPPFVLSGDFVGCALVNNKITRKADMEGKTMEYQSNDHSSSAATTASNGTIGSIPSKPASDSNNRKPASAQQLVRENVQYLIEQLEAGHSETLTAYLDAMVHFPNYSFGNVLLIARQKPEATNVAGMWAWNQLGRRVKRGEKGIAILAPMIGKSRKKKEETDDADAKQSALLGFRRVYVWDVSQTDGTPLPELDKVTGEAGASLDRLREYVNVQGITLAYDESIAPALGMAGGTTIRILPGQTQPEEFSTLVHELAHLMLKHGERRTATTKTIRETEAEAVAFVVGKGIGLTTSTASADYINLYHGNAALLMESLEAVQQTAAVILAALKVEEPVSQEVPDTTAEPAPETKRAHHSRTETATTEAA